MFLNFYCIVDAFNDLAIGYCNLVFQKSIFIFGNKLCVLREAMDFIKSYHGYDNCKWHTAMNCIVNSVAKRSKVAISEKKLQKIAALTESSTVEEQR